MKRARVPGARREQLLWTRHRTRSPWKLLHWIGKRQAQGKKAQ